MIADIPILLVVFALVGAVLNSIRGYSHPDQTTFNIRLFVGALIASTTTALALVQFADVSTLGPVGIAIFGLLAGFGGDYLATKTK